MTIEVLYLAYPRIPVLKYIYIYIVCVCTVNPIVFSGKLKCNIFKWPPYFILLYKLFLFNFFPCLKGDYELGDKKEGGDIQSQGVRNVDHSLVNNILIYYDTGIVYSLELPDLRVIEEKYENL